MTSLVLSIAIAAFHIPAIDTPKFELTRYQGTWVLVSEEFQGKTTPAEKLPESLRTLTYTIRGDKIVFSTQGEERTGRVKLDPRKNPKSLDLIQQDGLTLKAIYMWDGENLKVCASSHEGDRPTEFKTGAGSNNCIRIWKKKK